MKGYCIECGAKATQLHHVIPWAIKSDAFATVALCDQCHALLHGRNPRKRSVNTDHRHLVALGLEKSNPIVRLQLATAFLCNYFGGDPAKWGLKPASYQSKLDRVEWLSEHMPEYMDAIFEEFREDLCRPGDRFDPIDYWRMRDNQGDILARLLVAYQGHQTSMFN